VVDLTGDVGDDQHQSHGKGEEGRALPQDVGDVGDVEEGGDGEDGVADNEADDERVDHLAYPFLQVAIGLEVEVDGAVHGEECHGGDAHPEGVGMKQTEEAADEFMVGIERDAPGDVAHGHTDEEGGEGAAGGEADVPHLAPPAPGFLAAEFDGHGAEDEGEEQEDEGEVEAGKDGGVDFGEGGKERTASGDEPDFVAVPDGADGVIHETAFAVAFDEWHEDADAEIEAVEDGVAAKENAYE